jgi:hypothetical protein
MLDNLTARYPLTTAGVDLDRRPLATIAIKTLAWAAGATQ